MSWHTRQTRLRNMLQAQKPYVFQLVAFYEVWPIPLQMSMDLIREYQLDFRKMDRFDFPKTKIGDHEFDAGFISQETGHLINAQPLYTSYPYPENQLPDMEADASVIKAMYLDAREKVIPGTRNFSGSVGGPEGENAHFGYFVNEYNPKTFPAGDMGRLKPYTVIPGRVIVPERSSFVDFEPHRAKYERPVMEDTTVLQNLDVEQNL